MIGWTKVNEAKSVSFVNRSPIYGFLSKVQSL